MTEDAASAHRSDWHLGRVDADAVIAYAMATNDPNPMYLRGEAVPPLFTVTLLLASHLEAGLTASPLVQEARGTVHGEHDTRILGQIRPGMPLQWQASLHGIRNSRGGALATYRTVVYDRQGTALVEHLWSNFSIGGRVDPEVGLAKPDHTFPEGARQRPAGADAVPVDRDQGFRYAGASGDRVGHAIDDETARSEGYPGKILQGLCTFGLVTGALVRAHAGGDPRRVRRLACRFSHPTFPGRPLDVRTYTVSDSEFAFEALQGDQTVIRHGRVEIA